MRYSVFKCGHYIGTTNKSRIPAEIEEGNMGQPTRTAKILTEMKREDDTLARERQLGAIEEREAIISLLNYAVHQVRNNGQDSSQLEEIRASVCARREMSRTKRRG